MPTLTVTRAGFSQALQIYRDTYRLPPDTENAMEWLWGYCADDLGLDKERVCDAIGYDETTVVRLLSGKYDGGLERIADAIGQLRTRVAGKVSGMIETPVTRRIFEALDYARNTGSIVLIRGETGRGKTYCVREWARRNSHRRTIYVRCPSGCTRAALVRAVALSSGIGIAGKTTNVIEAQIRSSFDRRRTLIVDEAGHLVPGLGSTAKSLLEFLRDIHDMCEAGLVLIFTSVYWEQICEGPLAPFFDQFIGRKRFEVHIPEGTIFRDEIEAIVRGYGFTDDAMPVAAEIAHERGRLRMVFGDLANARVIAEKQGLPRDAKTLRLARNWRLSGGAWTEQAI
jgi:hypothetical protein